MKRVQCYLSDSDYDTLSTACGSAGVEVADVVRGLVVRRIVLMREDACWDMRYLSDLPKIVDIGKRLAHD